MRYKIHVELFGMDGRVIGKEEVAFLNQTQSPLDTLHGFIVLVDSHVSALGREVTLGEPKGALKQSGEDSRIFSLPLDPPIQPGETRRLALEFSGRIPRDDKYHPGKVAAMFWHPMLTLGSSWSDLSGLLSPAMFEVLLTIPAGHLAAVSGERLEESSLPDGRSLVHAFCTKDLHFVWISSSDYRLSHARSPGGEIRVYFTDLELAQGPFIAEVASEVSSFYRDLLGSFPFPLVSFVPGRRDVSGGGNVAPRMLMLHQMHLLPVPEAGMDVVPTRRIVAHELGHLYWSDCVQTHSHMDWLALGLGMWIDQQYVESLGEVATIERSSIKEYLAAARSGYNTTIHQSEQELKEAHFNVNHVIRHGKGFAVVSMLEYLMGKEKFVGLLKDILNRYGSRTNILSEEDFFILAQKHYGEDLQWYFEQWVHTNKVLDYALGQVRERPDGLSVQVRRLGDAVMPVVVQVVTDKGAILQKRISGQSETQLVNFEYSDSLWTGIALDPEERLVDLDRSNNALTR